MTPKLKLSSIASEILVSLVKLKSGIVHKRKKSVQLMFSALIVFFLFLFLCDGANFPLKIINYEKSVIYQCQMQISPASRGHGKKQLNKTSVWLRFKIRAMDYVQYSENLY